MAEPDPIYQITNYEQGDEGGQMDFIASWKNSPVGSQISFHAMVDPVGGPVTLPLMKATITGALGIEQKVQAGYKSQIVLVFFPSATLPSDFEVGLRVNFPPI